MMRSTAIYGRKPTLTSVLCNLPVKGPVEMWTADFGFNDSHAQTETTRPQVFATILT
jgi:hypothetical protein